MANEFWPKKVKLTTLGLKSAGGFLAGAVGSILLFVLILLFQSTLNNSGASGGWFGGSGGIFPIVFAFVALLSSLIVSQVTYYFLVLIDGEKYKSSTIHFGQLALFSVILFVFFLPVYVVMGNTSPDSMIQIFMIHMLVGSFGIALIGELLNNYRYILLELYACFVGMILAWILIESLYGVFADGLAKIYALLIILPLTNALVILIKELFALAYWYYFHITGSDPLGDIFEQIKEQEREKYEEESSESTIY